MAIVRLSGSVLLGYVGASPTIANDLRPAVFVPLLVARDAVGHLGFESCDEHAPDSLAGGLI